MGNPISKITIKGFKSIRNLEDFELQNLNILIGPNGAGKSNFVGFFRLLRAMVESNLQSTINSRGGAFTHLFLGPKVTSQMSAELEFGHNAYHFTFIPTTENGLIFQEERIIYDGTGKYLPVNRSIGSGHSESRLKEQLEPNNKNRNIVSYIYSAISSWIVYHFHDTSDFAKVKLTCSKQDYEYLRPDAGNLAAFLLGMSIKGPKEYTCIKEAIQLVIPFFEDFILRDYFHNPQETLLEWTQKGSDYPFQPSQISDGSLRFICLATALLQPNPPSTILLDEPELGLHPHALALLAEMIKSASVKTQVIVSTQSPILIDYFEPQDIVVVNRENGESKFRRLDKDSLKVWLEDYSLGELWQKNIFEDSPGNE